MQIVFAKNTVLEILKIVTRKRKIFNYYYAMIFFNLNFKMRYLKITNSLTKNRKDFANMVFQKLYFICFSKFRVLTVFRLNAYFNFST